MSVSVCRTCGLRTAVFPDANTFYFPGEQGLGHRALGAVPGGQQRLPGHAAGRARQGRRVKPCWAVAGGSIATLVA